jgi:Tol biopolymer transport system component
VTKFESDWSAEGEHLAVTALDPRSRTIGDIWIVPLSGDHTPRPFLSTPFNEGGAVFSPDGRWLAYQSDESGRAEIYLTPFPGPGGKWQVSQSGGAEALWRRDGRALLYRSPDGTLFEAPVAERGAAVEVGTPRSLTQAPPNVNSGTGRTYAVAADSDRYLVLMPVQSSAAPLTLVTNWTAGLRAEGR